VNPVTTFVAPRFQWHFDEDGNRTGVEILDDWPRLLLVSDELINDLKRTDNEWCRFFKEGDELHFRLINGQARYRYLRRETETSTVWEGIE
jgi:hypothetical protein